MTARPSPQATLNIDHFAVACADLGRGVAWLERLLGVRMAPGGTHAHFGTHNRLLGLGPALYLEVIAPDPEAPVPPRPRWFALDHAPERPKLANWIAASQDLAALPGLGPATALRRGDLAWELTVPGDGHLPQDAALPTLIRWPEGVHPARGLPDHGLRLGAFEVHHPDADRLGALVLPRLVGEGAQMVSYHVAAAPALRVRIDAPQGAVWLE